MRLIYTVLMVGALFLAAFTIASSMGGEASVEQQAAQMLINESNALDEEVLKGKHWHMAVFNGVEYTIYTGPGDIAFCRPYKKEDK